MHPGLERILDVIQQNSGSAYRYPDHSNAMEAQVIPQARRDEEAALWMEFMPPRVHGVSLDAGCGRGAYTGLLVDKSEAVLAVDADEGRVRHARSIVGERAAFRVVALEDPVFSSEKLRGAFACVSCMQVLGHVPRVSVPVILDSFRNVLSTEGVLVLAVPFVNHFAEEHRVVQQSLEGHPVTTEKYDALAAQPVEGVLPVRHFTGASLRKLVEEAGFSVEEMRPYNWYSDRRADMMVKARVRRP